MIKLFSTLFAIAFLISCAQIIDQPLQSSNAQLMQIIDVGTDADIILRNEKRN